MTCKSTEFKKFQRRIRRTLYYANCGSKRPLLVRQMMAKVSNCFMGEQNLADFDQMTEKLTKQGYISPCNMLSALIYITRLRETNEQEFFQFTPTELYVSSLMVATKFLNDGSLQEFAWNDEWASVSGLDLSTLNGLELQLLNSLNWDISISTGNFEKTLNDFEKWLARDMIQQNGIVSYNELFVLSDMKELDVALRYLLTILLKMAIALMTIYFTLIVGLVTLDMLSSRKWDAMTMSTMNIHFPLLDHWMPTLGGKRIYTNETQLLMDDFSFNHLIDLGNC